uniref:Putative terminase small subunit n=2 Tax=viral metagenome TaxID=1070528 RepID=A0A6M3IZZ0_9ZZZZ
MARSGPHLKLNDPAKVQQIINEYFLECDTTKITKQVAHSKGITEVKTSTPYTMAGLARALRVSRETLNQYRHAIHPGETPEEKIQHERISDIISHARDRVHEQNVTLALAGCHDSRIAALNLASNYGYSQKNEVSGPGGGPLVINVVKFSE